MENNLIIPEDSLLPPKSNISINLDGLENVQNLYQKTKQKQNNIFLIKEELKNTEWTNLPDSPLTKDKQQEWLTYRNELKALLETNNDTIVWPTKPA